MTVYQSSFKEEGPITFLAYTDLKAWRRVKLHSGTVTQPPQIEYAGAGEAAFGVTMDNVLAGEQVAVMQFTGDGTFLVTSNVGTISEGDLLYGTASGMVTNVSAGVAQLIAMQPAAAQYEVIECMCYPYWSAAASGTSIADAGNFTSTATVEAATQEIYQHIASIKKIIPVPLTSFVDVAATQLTTFVGGAYTQPGLELTNSKALSIRWNNHGTPLAIMSNFVIPNDADITANMTLKVMASKTGATSGDAVTFLVALYNQALAALHDADTNFGGTTGAMTGTSTAKTVQTVSLTIALADLGASGTPVTLTIKPTDGTLGTDDLCLHAVWIEYKGKILTS